MSIPASACAVCTQCARCAHAVHTQCARSATTWPEDEDEDTDVEDSDQPDVVASSSSSHLPNPPAAVSTSCNPTSQLVFMYDVDEAVVKAM